YMIVLDVVNIYSHWRYDYILHYSDLCKINDHFPEANVLALTATAPLYLTSDLNQMLNKNFIIVKTTMNRENISLTHKNFEDDHAKLKWLLPLLEHSGPTIIYVSSKKMCLNLAKAIYQYGFLTGI